MTADTELLRGMTDAARKSFDACRGRAGTSAVIGYALCSDDSVTTFAPMAASTEGLAAYAHGSPEDFRFNPEEWDLDEEVAELDALADRLAALRDDCEDYEGDPDWHAKFRARIFELMVQALEALDAEGYFGTGADRDEIFLIAWVTDSEVPQKQGPDWSQRLNRQALHRAFASWLAETDYWD